MSTRITVSFVRPICGMGMRTGMGAGRKHGKVGSRINYQWILDTDGRISFNM